MWDLFRDIVEPDQDVQKISRFSYLKITPEYLKNILLTLPYTAGGEDGFHHFSL